jgi:hypothetical protein
MIIESRIAIGTGDSWGAHGCFQGVFCRNRYFEKHSIKALSLGLGRLLDGHILDDEAFVLLGEPDGLDLRWSFFCSVCPAVR